MSGLLKITSVVVVMVGVYNLYTLGHALDIKAYAQSEGWDEVSLEWDGLLDGFNVYYK